MNFISQHNTILASPLGTWKPYRSKALLTASIDKVTIIVSELQTMLQAWCYQEPFYMAPEEVGHDHVCTISGRVAPYINTILLYYLMCTVKYHELSRHVSHECGIIYHMLVRMRMTLVTIVTVFMSQQLLCWS